MTTRGDAAPGGQRKSRSLRYALAGLAAFVGINAAIVGTLHSIGIPSEGGPTAILPETAAGMKASATARFAATQSVNDSDIALLRSVARSDSLSFEPLVFIGFSALQDGRLEDAQRLLEAARDRRPRSRIARLALLEVYGRQGNLEATIGELIPLIRLEPEMVETLANEFFQTLTEPSQIALFARLMTNEPELLARITSLATQSANVPPELLTEFARSVDPQGNNNLRNVQGQALSALVRQGQFEAARALWRELSPSAPDSNVLVVNSAMNSPQNLPPFDWQLLRHDQGNAEWRDSSGLAVDYFGRGTAVFARQLMALPTGQYQLSVAQTLETSGLIAGDASKTGGLAWQLRCAGHAELIFREPLRSAELADIDLQMTFNVPSNCGWQWLELVSRGELRGKDGQRITVQAVVIDTVAEDTP